ncbi:hypothetical protein EDB80DRAFT_681709 [Ilyonectria destructans]|nr:hypothetical protein EDB80DRAFT_681709 [Ilyonectria destructans]
MARPVMAKGGVCLTLVFLFNAPASAYLGGQQDATQPGPVPTGAGTADWNRRLEPQAGTAQLQKLELELEEGGRVRTTKRYTTYCTVLSLLPLLLLSCLFLLPLFPRVVGHPSVCLAPAPSYLNPIQSNLTSANSSHLTTSLSPAAAWPQPTPKIRGPSPTFPGSSRIPPVPRALSSLHASLHAPPASPRQYQGPPSQQPSDALSPTGSRFTSRSCSGVLSLAAPLALAPALAGYVQSRAPRVPVRCGGSSALTKSPRPGHALEPLRRETPFIVLAAAFFFSLNLALAPHPLPLLTLTPPVFGLVLPLVFLVFLVFLGLVVFHLLSFSPPPSLPSSLSLRTSSALESPLARASRPDLSSPRHHPSPALFTGHRRISIIARQTYAPSAAILTSVLIVTTTAPGSIFCAHPRKAIRTSRRTLGDPERQGSRSTNSRNGRERSLVTVSHFGRQRTRAHSSQFISSAQLCSAHPHLALILDPHAAVIQLPAFCLVFAFLHSRLRGFEQRNFL